MHNSAFFISSATSQAGVATAAGEEAKDDHYLVSVIDHGGDFIPLVWSPFALSTLFTIADRTTVKSGVP